MRFLALFLLALSFASSSTAKIVIGSTPPSWPASYSTDYSSTYSPVPEFPMNGFIGVSNNEKIRVDSRSAHYSVRTIIVKGSEAESDVYSTSQFGDHSSQCRHSKRPFNPFLSNENNHCVEFKYKGEELFNGVNADGWSTVCSISTKDLSHHPIRGKEGGETIKIAMTYYYDKSTPLAVISSPLSGPAVNLNATIIYSNFQSVDPDATLFAPPSNCAEGEVRRWGRRGFGGGIYREGGIPRHHPEDFDELHTQRNSDGVIRSLADRKIHFRPREDNEYNGKNDREIIQHRPDHHILRRHRPAGHPMGEMEDKPGMRMGGMPDHHMGGGIEGDHPHMGGGDINGDHIKDLPSKRLSARATKMAMQLIHFVNAKYLQKHN